MNATETEYALILESMKGKGEILRYEYEGITLRWLIGDKIIQYTPDFYVLRSPSMLLDGDKPWAPLFIEVKGAFTGGKFERAVERHRHARTRWPEFAFELHQKKRGQWTRLM